MRPHLDGYRLITWEPRGFACSDLRGPYSIDVWTSDLAHLLDALGIERAHVWANGFSSYVAFALAADDPDRVGAVIAYTDVWAGDPAKDYATRLGGLPRHHRRPRDGGGRGRAPSGPLRRYRPSLVQGVVFAQRQ